MRGLAVAFLSLTVFFGSMSLAYDEDTHFYGTYAMARFAGINDIIAQKIALSAEWMDESYISDPTSMIVLPITGVKKRRLLHFPSSRFGGKISKTQHEVLGFEGFEAAHAVLLKALEKEAGYTQDDMDRITIWTTTQENDMVASQLIMEGLHEGNLMKAAASLHVIEDSYAHAGTPAEEGHAEFWHWPDRPFDDPAKYARMVHTVFKALVAIRDFLPAQDLNKNLNTAGGHPNYLASADELADRYTRMILPVISYNVLVDKEYVTGALENFVQRARAEQYLNIDPLTAHAMISQLRIDGKTDTYTELGRLVREMLSMQQSGSPEMLRLRYVLSDMGMLNQGDNMSLTDFIAEFGETDPAHVLDADSDSLKNFVQVFGHRLLGWSVPTPLNKSNRTEMEDDSEPPRSIEMAIRIRRMQQFIEQNFGNKIEFIHNNSKDELGFGDEIREDAVANPAPIQDAKPGVEYVTFNLKEKNAFDRMIFQYLFPHMDSHKDLDLIVKVVHKFNIAKSFAAKSLAAGEAAFELRHLLPVFIHDTLHEHEHPTGHELRYQNPYELAADKASGVDKPLLGPHDVWAPDGTLRENQEAKLDLR